MDLTNRQQLIHYLQSHGLYTKKKLGQNFLVDRGVLEKIVGAAELSKEDCVVEVGPGLGVMTEELIKKADKVVAVELDQKLAKILSERFSLDAISVTPSVIPSSPSVIPAEAGILSEKRSPGHGLRLPEDDMTRREDDRQEELEIVNSDILRTNINELTKDCPSYKVVANIPYYITSKILRFFLEAEKKPETIVLLTQKEVAERICAKPGEMSILSVSVQYYGRPEIIGIVPKTSFFPMPEVDSAILKITIFNDQFSIFNDVIPTPPPVIPTPPPVIPTPPPVIPAEAGILTGSSGHASDRRRGLPKSLPPTRSGDDRKERDFFRCVKFGFASRRKTLLNNLSAGYHLEKNQVLDILKGVGLNDKTRAQELSVEKWKELCGLVKL